MKLTRIFSFNLKCLDLVTNEKICENTKLEIWGEICKKRRLKWSGKTNRMSKETLSKEVMKHAL